MGLNRLPTDVCRHAISVSEYFLLKGCQHQAPIRPRFVRRKASELLTVVGLLVGLL